MFRFCFKPRSFRMSAPLPAGRHRNGANVPNRCSKEVVMPKMKTRRGAAKRFKATAHLFGTFAPLQNDLQVREQIF